MKRVLDSCKANLLVSLAIFFSLSCSTNDTKTESDTFNISIKNESDPERRLKEEFEMLKNPLSGEIPKNIRGLELAEAAKIPLREEVGLLAANSYVFQGPNNIGGRTRALAYDRRFDGVTNRVILAGGVSGGMFRSSDAGQTWVRVSSLNDIHSVTCIAQDPRPGFQDTWYFGTGEAIGNSANGPGAVYYGHGIYKSIDNGITWNVLPNTATHEKTTYDEEFDFVSRIAINPINGEVYAASSNCIMKSVNGGNDWTKTLGDFFQGGSAGLTDVLITPSGEIYAAICGMGGISTSYQGIWKKNGNFWMRIAGDGTPSWFNADKNLGRIVLAYAPTSPNIIYALYYNGLKSTCSTPVIEAELGRYDADSESWTNLSANLPDEPGCQPGNDPFSCQGGYDLVIAVKPDNPNVVFIGGTNAYRSTDAFSTPNNIKRIGGYASPSEYSQYPNNHPDIHAFAFAPNNPNIMLCGTDGGIHEGNISQETVTWVNRNNNYNTLQFYYGAIDPTINSSKYIGGAQDIGNLYRSTGNNSFIHTTGGDGVSVGISNNNLHHYIGNQNGNVYRKGPDNPFNDVDVILTPPNLHSNRLFVTLFQLDPVNTTILYYADYNKLYRNARADTVTVNAEEGKRLEEITGVANTIGTTYIRSFANSWGAYNQSSSKLYFGTGNGKIYRLDNPRDCNLETPPVEITAGAGFPSATVKSIAVNPRNADTILAGISNYGVENIWFCGNATSANPIWTPVEGNLTLPSVRATAIVVNGNIMEYYVGTSTGLYSTTSLNGNATQWLKEGADVIGNSVVVDLDLRPSDNRLLVSTHGNGMFVTDVLLPVQLSAFRGQIIHGKAQLFWETRTEINNKGFELEKSLDGRTYSQIGFIQGHGSSTQNHNYTFSDPAVLQPVQFYRLKQLDKDGRKTISKVVKLNRETMPLQLASVVNPISTNLIFTLNEVPAKPIHISLFDGSGRRVLQQNLAANSGNVFRVNVLNLPNGIYTLHLQSEGFSVNRTVIKQK